MKCSFCSGTPNANNIVVFQVSKEPKDICDECYNERCYKCLQLKDVLETVELSASYNHNTRQNTIYTYSKKDYERCMQDETNSSSQIILCDNKPKICLDCIYSDSNLDKNCPFKFPHQITLGPYFNLGGFGVVESQIRLIVSDLYNHKVNTHKRLKGLHNENLTTVDKLDNVMNTVSDVEQMKLEIIDLKKRLSEQEKLIEKLISFIEKN